MELPDHLHLNASGPLLESLLNPGWEPKNLIAREAFTLTLTLNLTSILTPTLALILSLTLTLILTLTLTLVAREVDTSQVEKVHLVNLLPVDLRFKAVAGESLSQVDTLLPGDLHGGAEVAWGVEDTVHPKGRSVLCSEADRPSLRVMIQV